MSGRPRRAAVMKRKRSNNDNNYIPAPKKAPKKANVKVRTVTNEVAIMIRDKMSSKLVGNRDTQVAIIDNILRYMSNNQSLDPSVIDPRQLSMGSRSLDIDMKNIQSVYLFMVNLFCDQVHDASAAKDLGPMKQALKIKGLSNPLQVFNKYIDTVTWLDSIIKKELKNVDAKYKSLLTDTFTITNRSSDYRLNETVYMYNLVKLQKSIMNELPFKHTTTIPSGYSGFPGTSPMISFDQSSKASGPSVVSGTTVNALNASATPRYVISLPVISDLGSTQPSNPLAQFYKNMSIVVDMVQKDPSILETRNTTVDKLLTNRFMVLDNRKFNTTITYNNKIVIQTEFYIKKETGKVLVNVTKPAGGVLPGKIVSASDMTRQPSISDWIFKTVGDLNILLVSMASQSAALTGDRMAGGFYMLFSFLQKQNWLTVSGGKRVMFIFEGAGPTDIVVTNNFRTSDSQNYVNYLKRDLEKTKVERKTVPELTPVNNNRNRRNIRDATLNRFVASSGSSLNREKFIHTKKLLTGNSFRQFESLVNSTNKTKKEKLFTTIKKFPNKPDVKPSEKIKRDFYRTLASVSMPSSNNVSIENTPNTNKTNFIKTLGNIGVKRKNAIRAAGYTTNDRANYYVNVMKGMSASSSFVSSLSTADSSAKLNTLIIKGAMKNSIEKLYRNVPELSVMKNEDKLAKFTQWLMADGNTPFLKQFVKIKRLQNTPSIKDLKRSIISAVNLLGTNQKINGLVFETIKELLQYGD